MKNKIDLSKFLYWMLMIGVLLVAMNSCVSYRYHKAKKELINPQPKYGSKENFDTGKETTVRTTN